MHVSCSVPPVHVQHDGWLMLQPVLLSKSVAGVTQTAAVSRYLSSPNCPSEDSCFAEVSSLNVSSSFQILRRFQRKRSRNKHKICSKEFCRQTSFCPYIIGHIKKKKMFFCLHMKKRKISVYSQQSNARQTNRGRHNRTVRT